MRVLLNENRGPCESPTSVHHRCARSLSTMARNFCIFLCFCCSSVLRVKAARNRRTAHELLGPIRQRQSQLPSGSHDSAHWPFGQSSRRTSHQSPRPASMRRRDVLTEASMPAVYLWHGVARMPDSSARGVPGRNADLAVHALGRPVWRPAGSAGRHGRPGATFRPAGAAGGLWRHRGRRAPDRPGGAAGSPATGGGSARR